jgi:RNA-directed DNA polymerase
VVHCVSEAQARTVLAALQERMAQVGLTLHPDKTRIVVRHEAARSEWIRRWEGRRMSVT